MGGMDIEEVAANQPEQIFTISVDPVVGIQPYQCRQLAFSLGLTGSKVKELSVTMNGLYRLFVDKDLSLIEINPLIITTQEELVALRCRNCVIQRRKMKGNSRPGNTN